MTENIPKGWTSYRLGALVSEIADGGTPPRQKKEYFNGDIPWVVIEDIKFHIYETKEHLSKEGLRKSSSKLWPPGSVILSTGASIGNVGIAKVPLATKQGITGMIVKDELVSSEYLAHWFNGNKQNLIRYSQGSSIKEIRGQVLTSLKIILPPVDEQMEIISILNSVDSAIDETENVIAECERIKKGMMQRYITTHESNNTVPVTELFRIETGTTPRTDVVEYWDKGNIIWVTPADMNKLQTHEIHDSARHITAKALNETNLTQVPPGSLVLSTRAPVGYVGINTVPVTFNQGCKALVPKTELNIVYYYFVLLSLRNHLIQMSDGTTFNELMKNTLKKIRLPNPHIDEQNKIADQFNSLLSRKYSEELKLDKLLISKKALMQKLLTGKIRVKVN